MEVVRREKRIPQQDLLLVMQGQEHEIEQKNREIIKGQYHIKVNVVLAFNYFDLYV